MNTHTLYIGDALDVLRTLRGESVHCVVTSPPYFALRDYQIAGQIGLEDSPEDYVRVLVDVFREVRRVLRSDGTLWLNVGDSYAGSRKGGGGSFASERRGWTQIASKRLERGNGRWGGGNAAAGDGLKRKDLIGIPWRVAFALQADGWWLRSDVVWAKPNPMPESVKDRPTRSHEYLFLLAKSERYYYDADAIREESVDEIQPRNVDSFYQAPGQPTQTGLHRATKVPSGWDTSEGSHGNIHRTGRTDKQRGHSRRHVGFNERWDLMTHAEQAQFGRNRRDVWTIAPEPFPGPHFATFPQALVEPCILAGCPEGGIVLDPFGGAGTTTLVAKRLGRRSIYIDLNAEYAKIAERRCFEQREIQEDYTYDVRDTRAQEATR